MGKVWLNEVGKLWVDIERVANLGHAGSLVLLLFALALPEALAGGLPRGGARVDGGGWAVGEDVELAGGRLGVVGGEEGLAGCAKGAEGVEVELGEVVGVGVFGLGLRG